MHKTQILKLNCAVELTWKMKSKTKKLWNKNSR